MESVRAWAIGLCAAAIGCTALQTLAPKNGLGKLFTLLLSAFFLCCMIAPLLSLRGMTELSWDSFPQEVQDDLLRERLNRQLGAQVDEAVRSMATGVLAAYGYTLEKAEANTDTLEDGYIYMTGVTVWVDMENARHATAIKVLLEQRFGVPAEVRVTDNG